MLAPNDLGFSMMHSRFLSTRHAKTDTRIGPSDQEVISTLVGHLLGDSYGEKRRNATRIHLHMSSRNREYLHALHQFYTQRGYCCPGKPRYSRQIGRHNKVYFSCRFRTYSFQSLNCLYDSFYPEGKKRVPRDIVQWLEKRALAVWLMDHGGKSGNGVVLSTERFCREDVLLLQTALLERFGLQVSLQKHASAWRLYFAKSQVGRLSEIVKGDMYPSMYYKVEENPHKS